MKSFRSFLLHKKRFKSQHMINSRLQLVFSIYWFAHLIRAIPSIFVDSRNMRSLVRYSIVLVDL